jgi:hypothetical protein
MLSARGRVLSVAAGIAAVFVVTTASSGTEAEAQQASEVVRLRAHFTRVIQELRGAEVAHLTKSQRAARKTLIERLEDYAGAGRFPHNHVRPSERVPIFRDEHQTLCAMGFLIASTGRTDIVDHVTSSNNLVYIRELAQNAALQGWLDSTGLTLAEAARIQPMYDGGRCCAIGRPDQAAARAASDRRNYAVVSAGGAALNGAAMVFNLASVTSRHKLGTWLGLASGGAQAIYGGYAVQKNDSRRGFGFANIAIGATSAAIATWRMRQPREAKPSDVALSVAPFASTAGSVGFALSARM